MAVRVDYDQASTWQLLYRATNRDPKSADIGAVYTYGRDWAKHGHDPHQDDDFLRKYRTRWGHIQPFVSGTGLIVGCGFGFLLEEALAAGEDPWGTDTSTFIQADVDNQTTPEVVPRVLQKDIRDADAQSFFKANTSSNNGTFDWIVTEEMLSSYDDADHAGLLDACEDLLGGGQVNGRIVHVVSVNAKAPFNSKTLAEWAALRADHTWISVQGEVA